MSILKAVICLMCWSVHSCPKLCTKLGIALIPPEITQYKLGIALIPPEITQYTILLKLMCFDWTSSDQLMSRQLILI